MINKNCKKIECILSDYLEVLDESGFEKRISSVSSYKNIFDKF